MLAHEISVYLRQQRLGRSPNETFWVEVLGKLVAKFRKQEEWCLCLERPQMRVCDLLLGPPFDRAWLADQLEEAVGQLGVEQAAWQEVDTELEAQRTLATRVCDLVLDGANGTSSLLRHYPWRQRWSKVVSMLWMLTGSARGLGQCWMPPYRICQSWRPSWRCSGPGATQT
jgi:hypothetical protein